MNRLINRISYGIGKHIQLRIQLNEVGSVTVNRSGKTFLFSETGTVSGIRIIFSNGHITAST